MDLSFRQPTSMAKSSLIKSRYVSLSPSEKDYLLFTRSLPTSNPIRQASPDQVNTPEKVPMTKSPFPFEDRNRFRQPQQNLSASQPNPSELEVLRSEVNQLRKELAGKTLENERLSRSRNLNGSELVASSPLSMRESEAKIVAKRFAEDRLKAEQEAQAWMLRCQELMKRLQEYEQGNRNSANMGVIQDLVAEIKAWEEKSKEIEKINKEIRSEADFFKKKNDENEISLRKFLKELELWKHKYESFDREVSQQILKYEENIIILTKALEKATSDLPNTHILIKKQEAEVLVLQNQVLEREFLLSKERQEKSKKQPNEPNKEIEHEKIVLLSGMVEDFKAQIKVWEERCLAIESEWSGKYRELEGINRKLLVQERTLQDALEKQKGELEPLRQKNEIYNQNIKSLQSKLSDFEKGGEGQMQEVHRMREREGRLLSENEELRVNEAYLKKELENRALAEGILKKEIEILTEKCKSVEIRSEKSLRDMNETMRKSQNSKEITEMAKKIQADKNSLETEILSLKSKLQSTFAERDDLELRVTQLKNTVYEREFELNLKKQELFAKDQEIAREFISMKQELIVKDQEINSKKQEIYAKDQEIARLRENLQREITAQEEIRKDRELIKRTPQKIDIPGISVKDLQELVREGRELRQDKVEIEAERLAYEITIGQMKGRINDLEITLATVIRDFDESKRTNSTLLREKEEYRKKVALAENFKGQAGVFSKDFELKKQQENWEFKEFQLKAENERRALEGQNTQLKGMIENLKGNLELSYAMLEERKRERDDALRKLEGNTRSSQKIQGKIEGAINGQMEVSRERYEFLLKQCDELKSAKDQYKTQAERNSEALTIKNQEFIAKLHELEELKTKYQKSLLSLSTLEAKFIEKLQSEEMYIA